MQLCIVMLLVTLLLTSHGLEQVQDKLYYPIACSSLMLSKGMDQAFMSVLHGMALGTIAPTRAPLTYTVSKTMCQWLDQMIKICNRDLFC